MQRESIEECRAIVNAREHRTDMDRCAVRTWLPTCSVRAREVCPPPSPPSSLCRNAIPAVAGPDHRAGIRSNNTRKSAAAPAAAARRVQPSIAVALGLICMAVDAVCADAITSIDPLVSASSVFYPLSGGVGARILSASSSSVSDSSVNEATAASVGVFLGAAARDPGGYSALFNGSAFDSAAQGIYCMSPSGLPVGGSAYTVAAWVKLAVSPPSHIDTILNFGSMVDSQYYALRVLGGNQLMSVWWNRDEVMPIAPYDLYDGQWHHVAESWGVQQGLGFAAGPRLFYVDGELFASGNLHSPPNFAAGTALRVGQNNPGNHPLQGLMSEVGVWNRVLNITEIQMLAYTGKLSAAASSATSVPLAAIIVPIVVAAVISLLLLVLWRNRSNRNKRRKQLQQKEREGPVVSPSVAAVSSAVHPQGFPPAVTSAPGGPIMVQMAPMQPASSFSPCVSSVHPTGSIPAAARPVSAAGSVRLHVDAETGVQNEGVEGVPNRYNTASPVAFNDHSADPALMQPAFAYGRHAALYYAAPMVVPVGLAIGSAPVVLPSRAASESMNRIHVELFGLLDTLSMRPLSVPQRARVEAVSSRVRAAVDELLGMERSVGLTLVSPSSGSSDAIIARIEPDSPAADLDAGLCVGDSLLSIEGCAVRSVAHAEFLLQRSLLVMPGQIAALGLRRDGERLFATITPMAAGGAGADAAVLRDLHRIQQDLHTLRTLAESTDAGGSG